jgi:hypothetical protein
MELVNLDLMDFLKMNYNIQVGYYLEKKSFHLYLLF